MRYFEGQVIEVEAIRRCRLTGRTFRPGDLIRVELVRDWASGDDIGDGGPWGWGGFTGRTVKALGWVRDLDGRLLAAPGPEASAAYAAGRRAEEAS